MSRASMVVASFSVYCLVVSVVCMFSGYGLLIVQALRRRDSPLAFSEIMRARDYRLLHVVGGWLVYIGAAFGAVAFGSFFIAAFFL